jgi:hypothetical protein
MIDPVPPWTIGVAIACALLILPIFALVWQVAAALRESGRRLIASVVLASALWVCLLTAGAALGFPIRGIDIAAGVAILLAGAICAFLIVSLLAWGFTVSIVRDLGEAAKPLSLGAWKAAFGRGVGFDAFARDRLALLTTLGVARVNGRQLTLTDRGRMIARLARLGMIYFAIERR